MPFKSIRVTLSDEAVDRMEHIMKSARFRSASSTIEECIRVTYDLMQEVYSVSPPGAPPRTQSEAEVRSFFERAIMRLSRFTGARLVPP